ncbi:hypothetical protein B0I35DRAFT_453560 [Stachybotrys elegans]|uniref:Uncharacterized protein n=1 Tax=Stachybotrys elegans TaxID=80388 RepID=A0A8K0SG48_9HYPO|nr:hypothetical protein B0I35DRAFT_453560 [Stachybotrys elegans]
MNDDPTPFASAEGLGFFRVNVADYPVSRPIKRALDTFFEWFGLGLYKTFGARAGDYNFRKTRSASDVDCLIIHLLTKGSRVTCWKGSHVKPLPHMEGENNLWLVPRAALRRIPDIAPMEATFEEGGFMIRDPGTVVEISKGHAITFAVGRKEVLRKSWKPMKMPRSKELEDEVALLHDRNVGVNIEYLEEDPHT